MKVMVQHQTRRGRFEGVLQIVRFNRRQYALGCGTVASTGAWCVVGAGPAWLCVVALAIGLAAAWWCVASLVVSHWIYDRSGLYGWDWIPGALSAPPGHWLNLHAGLDDGTTALQELFPAAPGTAADFFDAAEMTEPSIHRARSERNGEPPAMKVDARRLPFPDRSFDTVFLLFAAHEIRTRTIRVKFLREVARVLAPGGTVLLVEHFRDPANFVAFGPGCLHFFPGREWKRLCAGAGLQLAAERRITPFVAALVLRRES
jgi:SAM-dependent methyltransferase